jgi:signal transduction histidine kinase
MEFRYELVDLRRLVSNSVITGGPLFRGKQQRLETELPPEPMLVNVDPDRTEQIFLNLLSNANKFTDAGKSIRVVAFMDAEYCCVEVHDEGIGIPADQHAFIFEDFAQVNHPRRVSGGTGLGLGLARKFAEAQGGSLTLRSVEGRGSTFTVRLPRRRALAALAG